MISEFSNKRAKVERLPDMVGVMAGLGLDHQCRIYTNTYIKFCCLSLASQETTHEASHSPEILPTQSWGSSNCQETQLPRTYQWRLR